MNSGRTLCRRISGLQLRPRARSRVSLTPPATRRAARSGDGQPTNRDGPHPRPRRAGQTATRWAIIGEPAGEWSGGTTGRSCQQGVRLCAAVVSGSHYCRTGLPLADLPYSRCAARLLGETTHVAQRRVLPTFRRVRGEAPDMKSRSSRPAPHSMPLGAGWPQDPKPGVVSNVLATILACRV